MGRRIKSTGFWVGWSCFSSSEPPMMNFGLGDAQIVEFSPALPYQGAFFFRTNQQGSCWKPVQGPGEDGATLIPDDLLMVLEADAQETIEDLARKLRGVPHISDLK